ncbi:MAG: hypothetical protein AAF401_10520 [Pseudomonadota bacterium]
MAKNAESEMTDERFEELAFAHGPRLDDWPADIRQVAEAHRMASPTAAAALAAVSALEERLAEAAADAPEAEPSAALMARILADAADAAPKPVASRPVSAPVRTPLRARLLGWLSAEVLSPAAACIAAGALGLWLGYAGPSSVAYAASAVIGIEEPDEIALLVANADPYLDAITVLEGGDVD